MVEIAAATPRIPDRVQAKIFSGFHLGGMCEFWQVMDYYLIFQIRILFNFFSKTSPAVTASSTLR